MSQYQNGAVGATDIGLGCPLLSFLTFFYLIEDPGGWSRSFRIVVVYAVNEYHPLLPCL